MRTFNDLSKIAEPFEYGKADPALITELEEKVGNEVPHEFKDFLLKWGGYKMDIPQEGNFSFIFNFPVTKGGRDLIGFSQSLTIKSILRRCETWGESLPDKAIIFEECGDGSSIFMSMTPGTEGEIYYIERDRYLHFPEFDDYEDEDAAVEAFDPVNGVAPNIFTKLGNSFDEFIQNIEIVEEDNEGNLSSVELPIKE